MRLRRAGSLVLALALAACTKVTQNEQPASFVFASFNSDTGAIPLPNDLALQAVPSMVVTATNLRGAQKELLQAFIDGGGFPNDQEVPVTIPFNTVTWSETAVNPVTGFAGNYVAGAPPALDLTTVTSTTVVLKRVDGEAADVPYEASYDAVKGVLTLRKVAGANGRRWDAGARYVVAVRGGPNGVKTTDGQEISPDSAIGLVSRNVDLSLAANRPPKTPAFTAAEIAKLEGLRKVLWNPLPWCRISGTWNPPINPATGTVTPALCSTTPGVPSASAFAAAGMPADEVATLATFGVAPASGTVALIDAGSGVAPLPIDLLRTTAPATAGGPYTVDLNDGFGPLKAGLATLDGFSTTAMLLAQTSIPVDAGTVNGANVFLYKIGRDAGGAPSTATILPELKHQIGLAQAGAGGNPFSAKYVAQPTPIIIPVGGPLSATVNCPATATGGCSPVIGLQPSVGAPLSATTTVYLPPLDQASTYAVVITKRVKDMLGNPLAKPTVGKIVLDAVYDPSVAIPGVGDVSVLSGVSNGTAAALTRMRRELAPVWAALPAGTTKADVALAYTFRTQTNTAAAAGVLAFAAGAAPTGATFFTPAQVAGLYGVPATAFPAGTVAEFAEVPFNTMNLLLSGLSQGAFDPAHPTPEPVTALVALPDPASVTGACPAGFPATSKCAPLVVFRHGIPRAKGDMLPIAAALTAKGFVVAAIDAEKHGDRTYCGAATQAAADRQCFNPPTNSPAATCVADEKLKTAADTGVVGRCSNGQLLRKRVDCAAPFNTDGTFNAACFAPKGIPLATGNFVFSLNLFRFRDTVRQDVIDEAALVNALAPAAPRAAGADAFAAHLAESNLAVDPGQVYLASLSMGSENTALSLAVNPRFKKGAFQSGFSIVDVSINPASSDHATLVALLAASNPPIVEGTADYLKFVQVAKWVLDPADAANYGALIAASAKPVLSQIGLCDPRIPNAQSQHFSAMLGLPVPLPEAGGTGFTQWFINAGAGAVCPAAAVDHGFLVDPTQSPTLTAQAQASFADFLATGAAQPITVRP